MQTVIYIFYVAKNNYVVISEIVFIFVVFATRGPSEPGLSEGTRN